MKKVCFNHIVGSLLLFGLLLSSNTMLAQRFASGPHGSHHISSASANSQVATWENIEAAANDDNSNAARSGKLESGQSSQQLVFQNFNLSIPPQATVTGIEVVVIRKATLREGVRDKRIQLLRKEVPTGQNLHFAEPWDNQWTAAFYGGDQNLWGSKWTPADLNDPGFGIVVEVQGSQPGAQAELDEVNITVHYAFGTKKSLVSFSGITCQATAFSP